MLKFTITIGNKAIGIINKDEAFLNVIYNERTNKIISIPKRILVIVFIDFSVFFNRQY